MSKQQTQQQGAETIVPNRAKRKPFAEQGAAAQVNALNQLMSHPLLSAAATIHRTDAHTGHAFGDLQPLVDSISEIRAAADQTCPKGWFVDNHNTDGVKIGELFGRKLGIAKAYRERRAASVKSRMENLKA